MAQGGHAGLRIAPVERGEAVDADDDDAVAIRWHLAQEAAIGVERAKHVSSSRLRRARKAAGSAGGRPKPGFSRTLSRGTPWSQGPPPLPGEPRVEAERPR